MEVGLELVERAEPEHAALPARVGRLEDGGKANRRRGRARLGMRSHGGELGLGDTVLGQPAPHGHLVGHHVGGLRADPRQPEPLRDRGDDGHGPVGRDRHHTGDAVPPGHVCDGLGVAEVDHLRLVRRGESRRVGVPVHRHHPGAQLARAFDRPPLVTSAADEEDRAQHGRDATEPPLRAESGRGTRRGSSARREP